MLVSEFKYWDSGMRRSCEKGNMLLSRNEVLAGQYREVFLLDAVTSKFNILY